MPKKPKLIIVESPTKARTISRFVGSAYVVKSSYGHIRDLPQKNLGIDVEKNFEPKYVVPKRAQRVIKELRADAKKAEAVILATDEDREGEAIAWHLVEALGLKNPKSKIPAQSTSTRLSVNRAEGRNQKRKSGKPKTESGAPEAAVARIVFHEITKKAIAEALKNPREIDMRLVDSQQARRVLDRLVGYKLSPLLWKKISKGLSAGRVQSVALRLIVEREQEREKFKPQEYWTIEALLEKAGVKSRRKPKDESETPPGSFWTRLARISGKTLKKLDIKNEDAAKKILKNLENTGWRVLKITENEIRRSALPPFTTSTLQQAASRRLGFTAKQTMMFAQQLYEGVDIGEEGATGLITYMRTDSVNLSEESLGGAKDFIAREFGDAYAAEAPKKYQTKSRLAQEAHEAIRPTDISRTPDSLRAFLDKRQWKLYDLIWRRFAASQMPAARFRETDVEVEAGNHVFEARGLVQIFDGHLKVYPAKTAEVILPQLASGETLALLELASKRHETEPPPRFNEASLVKTLEEYGIGRPSTYAPIMSTIQERGYVKKDDRRYFYPADVGKAVSDLLVEHFPEIVDVKFTATMEEDLDKVAEGEMPWTGVIREFYEPFAKHLAEKHETIEKLVEKTDETCEKCGKPMIIRFGRFGRFLACSGFPECKNTKPVPGSEEAKEAEAGANAQESSEKCEKCGAALVQRRGRFGPFWGCSRYPECTYIKKKNYSIGIKCPKCGEGDVVSRRTRSRRIFYGCSRYPACDFATWTRPGTEGEKKEEKRKES